MEYYVFHKTKSGDANKIDKTLFYMPALYLVEQIQLKSDNIKVWNRVVQKPLNTL